MRRRTKALLRIIAPLAVVGAMVLTAGTAVADEIEQLKLVINIHDDSLMGEDYAQTVSKAVNDILKQCDKYGIRMRVTPEIRTGVTEIAGTPVPGENVTEAQETEINKAGEQEVKNGGYKVTVIDGFSNPQVMGSTTRRIPAVPNAIIPPPMPSSAVDDDQGGDTWAHELGHGLGLEHEGDTNNLMYHNKADRTGTELTEDQCQKLKNGFRRRGAEKRCSEEQQQQGTCEPGTESVNDATFDPAGDVSNPIVDVEATVFTFDLDPVTPSLITATRVGLFPDTPVSATYQIGFDTDNDPATGGMVGPFGGFEFAAVVEVWDIFPFVGTATASLIELPGGLEVIPLDLEVLQVFHHIDVEEPPEVPEEELAAEVALSIPVGSLGPLANPIRVATVAVSGLDEDVVEPDTLNTLPALGPELVVSPRTTRPGQLLSISGSGFAPLSELTLLLADEVLLETTTLGDSTFSTSADTPPLPDGHYLLDAIDAGGNVGLEVITVTTAIGGVAELPEASDPSGLNYIALAALAAAVLVALSAGAWYARRRWVR
jgi:hypothetical protein